MTRRDRGFTLLELIAALAIFALMSVMAYGGLQAVMSTRDGLETNYDRIEAWQRAVHRLRMDIEQARPRPIRDEFGDAQPAMWMPEDARLELTRGGRANPLLQRRPSLERVAIYLEDDKLQRASWIVLDRTQTIEPRTTTLLDGIRELRWRFLPENAEDWIETWPQDTGNALFAGRSDSEQLPAAVELEMDTAHFGLIRLNFLVSTQ